MSFIQSITGSMVASIGDVALLPLQGLFSGDFLYLAVVFFVLAILAAIFGARGVAGVSMEVARWFIIIFVVLAIISILL